MNESDLMKRTIVELAVTINELRIRIIHLERDGRRRRALLEAAANAEKARAA